VCTLLERHVGIVEVDGLDTGGHQLRNIGSKLHHQFKLCMKNNMEYQEVLSEKFPLILEVGGA
jgi:hypothetical protein